MNAIFTIVQNDTTFTKRWVDYHGQAFNHVFILDHDSVGDALEILELIGQGQAQVVQVHHVHSYDAAWMAQTVRHFQTFLLQSYDLVCFAAVDEFLVPRDGSLENWVQQFEAGLSRVCRASGYEVVHHKDQEPPLDWDADLLLAQRKVWYPCRTYSKPVAGKVPLYWAPGFFDATNMPERANPDLLLVHLHRIDYTECLRKHREVRAREWLPEAKNEGPFRQNLVEEPDRLSRWMLCDADDSANYAKLEEIPAQIKIAL